MTKMYFVPEEHRDAMMSVLKKIEGKKQPGAVFFVTPEEMWALQASHVIDVPEAAEVANGRSTA
ncbi:hypothetical protein [Paraburkholderia unamae]|uniref:Nitrogen regulatory protein P-II family n=1 Tax=Paraburkholderia unamae TaxID=219649 RepID=A0ABX5KIE3_9BURK|nr:hypothetical protein [Paraburkholderia unamae]PVX77179.1 hypothetical protein C7402_115238 [Paraburkholderia unamae]